MDIPRYITAIATLLWPVIVLVAVLIAPRVVKWLLNQDKNLTVKVGGVEITVQQAVEEARKNLEDVTAKVNGLRTAERAEATPGPRSGPRADRILWVDDRPTANAFERANAEDLGWRITFAQSTREAAEKLSREGPFDLIVSDIGREEDGRMNYRAGIDLVERVRSSRDQTPVIFYSSDRSIGKVREELARLTNVHVTSSPSDLALLIASRIR